MILLRSMGVRRREVHFGFGNTIEMNMSGNSEDEEAKGIRERMQAIRMIQTKSNDIPNPKSKTKTNANVVHTQHMRQK